MKMTKRIVSLLILSALLLVSTLAFGGTALAAGQDKSRAGWYYVNTTSPADHTYSNIYNRPSSSNGKNLGRVNDGEKVYVYWVENGTGKKDSKWGYCKYDGTEGYIRWENLSKSKPMPKPTSKPTYKPVPKPTSMPQGSYVLTTGSVNIRSGAGRGYDAIGSVGKGVRVEYLNESAYDERPVLWYKVRYNGRIGWISSMYAELVGGSKGSSDSSRNLAEDDAEGATELSGYYLKDLETTAHRLGLENYRRVVSEAPDTFSNESLTISGYLGSVVEGFQLVGKGYKIYGVTIGMSINQAKKILAKTNLTLYTDEADWISYEHPSGPDTLIDCDGYDSVIHFEAQNGIINEISWSTYTG